MIVTGDCLDVMAGMEPESVDAIVTDPPYGLEFMGKEWDRLWDKRDDGHKGRKDGQGGMATWPTRPTYEAGAPAQQFHHAWATAALRVARPGAYLLAFGGTRTFHRLACAIEDAGWIIRDTLVWAYAQGFRKSPALLKPAFEPIVMARKPGPLRPLDIDGCRIPTTGRPDIESKAEPSVTTYGDGLNGSRNLGTTTKGREPANLILTDPIFDGGWDGVVGGGVTSPSPSGTQRYARRIPRDDTSTMKPGKPDAEWEAEGYGDAGTYSRYFLLPTEGRSDKPPAGDTRMGDAGEVPASRFYLVPKAPTSERIVDGERSPHPTQKPEALIRHLVKLVTPADGVVLDPFLGSGTLGVVCHDLGIRWIGIEREPEYAEWARRRVEANKAEWERVPT